MNVAVSVEILQHLESPLEDRSDGGLFESLGISGLHEVQAGAFAVNLKASDSWSSLVSSVTASLVLLIFRGRGVVRVNAKGHSVWTVR